MYILVRCWCNYDNDYLCLMVITMSNDIVDALLDRSASFVVRWHQRPNNGLRESIAEHSAWVARIAMYIAYVCRDADLINWRLLFETALLHDEAETITGDTPGGVKTYIPGAKEITKQWELTALNSLFNGLPCDLAVHLKWCISRYIRLPDACPEYIIIKLADMLSAISYARIQISMGNSLFRPIFKAIAKDIYDSLNRHNIFHTEALKPLLVYALNESRRQC